MAAHWLLAASLLTALTGPARAADEAMVEFLVVRTDTLIGLSASVLVSPTAWREVARLNRIANANLILPGQRLRIPVRLLRGDAVSSTLVSVTGANVRVGTAAGVLGAPLGEGEAVQTGADSSAVLALADGSRVRVPPSSLAQVAASRRYGDRRPSGMTAGAEGGTSTDAPSGWFAGTMRVMRGSVEVFATKVLRFKPLEVVTPTAVVGVRGTQFRVALDEGPGNRTHAEVLEGKVRFEPSTAPGLTDLGTAFGASVDASGRGITVAPLLPAPDLGALSARFERPVVRLLPAAVSGPLRVQVAADPAFDQIVSDQQIAAGSEVRIAGLDDGQWYWRARRIDPAGIEGLDALGQFVLKARPEPPAYLQPRSDAKQAVGVVDFAWAPNLEAPHVRFQVAQDPDFARIVDDRDDLDTPNLHADLSAPGDYYWRLASIRANGDHGPFGDPQRFELRPLPAPADVERSADGKSLTFKWSGRAEDRQRVEFASDPTFSVLLLSAEVGASEWTLPLPARSGRYYFRYRTVEPDGFVGPYSATLVVDVPRDWWGLGVLFPLVVLLL